MRSFQLLPEAGGQDLEQVRQAAAHLKGQACTVAARHISDGMLRLQFNREVAYYAQGIVTEVESGRLGFKEAINHLEQEKASLLNQPISLARKSLGLAGGVLQVTSGAGICYASVGTLCAFAGAPLIAHGANNIYENGNNLINDTTETQGPVRKLYQQAAIMAGGEKFHGNMAYGAVDLTLSVYGGLRKVPSRSAWRLYRYLETDKVRAWRNSTKDILAVERSADTITIESMYNEWKSRNE